jgi:hypothetical protein
MNDFIAIMTALIPKLATPFIMLGFLSLVVLYGFYIVNNNEYNHLSLLLDKVKKGTASPSELAKLGELRNRGLDQNGIIEYIKLKKEYAHSLLRWGASILLLMFLVASASYMMNIYVQFAFKPSVSAEIYSVNEKFKLERVASSRKSDSHSDKDPWMIKPFTRQDSFCIRIKTNRSSNVNVLFSYKDGSIIQLPAEENIMETSFPNGVDCTQGPYNTENARFFYERNDELKSIYVFASSPSSQGHLNKVDKAKILDSDIRVALDDSLYTSQWFEVN